jgi:PAS domain S-box-containing protein
MNPAPPAHSGLKQSVEARDRLVLQAEHAQQALHQQVVKALGQGDLHAARAAVGDTDARLAELAENLRVYQAELHAQADELAASQARTQALLARFSTLFAHMPVAALLVGDNGELLEFNGRAQDLLGLRQRPLAARFMRSLVQAQAFQERVRPAFLEARASGASMLDDVPFVGADGRSFSGELHVSWLASAPGLEAPAPGPYVCALIDRSAQLRDLHALRSATEALRRSEAFLADSARLARLGGWELQLQPRAWRFAPELRALLELPPEAPAQLDTLLDRCAPAQRPALAAALAAAEKGQAFELELDVHTCSGRHLHVLAVGRPDAGEAGGLERAAAELATDAAARTPPDAAPLRVSGVFQDITGPTLARQQISELTERLSVASAAGGIGVWDWVADSGQVVLDQRMARLLDLPGAVALSERAMRATLAQLLVPEDAERLAQALDQAVQQQLALNLELRLRGDSAAPGAGRERWLHVTGRAHARVDGHAARLVGLAWDCSAEHEAAHLLAAKEAAELASRSKSAFLSRMSHELRTPLNAILGFAQLMRMEAEAGDLVLKPHRVNLIETAARHLLDLVNEVLDVSRIESGQLEVRLLRFDLRSIVPECLPMVQGLADGSGVHIADHSSQAPPCWVLGDRLRLKEVLINLLSNAIKYNRPGGQVELRLRGGEEHCELVVADTGVGLDAQQLANLFQPFNRLGAEASGVEGSGMGLFVSQRFVELMGGSVAVASHPGQGSTFSVRLNAPPVG